MTDDELREAIDVWIGLATQASLASKMPAPSSEFAARLRADMDHAWDQGVLRNAGVLVASPGLAGKPEAVVLEQAVVLAGSGDATDLPKIRRLLNQVVVALRR